jgi:RND family efflux transporter MFP subunit
VKAEIGIGIDRHRLAAVVAPRWQVPVAFRTGGRIESRAVDVGDVVRAGDVLFTLDPADLEAAVVAAEADVRAARAQMTQAAAEAGRRKALRERGFAADAEVEKVTAAADTARETTEAAEAALTLARNRLSYATLRAPDSGIVTAVRAEAGEVVEEGAPVATLVRRDGVEIRIDIPETLIHEIRSFDASATLWAMPEARHPLRLREVSAAADPVTRTFDVRFTVPGDLRERLFPGMSAAVELTRPAGAPVAVLPATALVQEGGRAFVWQVPPDGTRALRTPVRLEAIGAGTVTVSGVPDGARIVSVGAHRIDAELPIRVSDDARAERPS